MTYCTIAYDVVLKRPGCVILQRVLGGSVSTVDLGVVFPAGSWLVEMSPNMGLYEVADKDQLFQLGALTETAMRESA